MVAANRCFKLKFLLIILVNRPRLYRTWRVAGHSLRAALVSTPSTPKTSAPGLSASAPSKVNGMSFPATGVKKPPRRL
jgi:hypothetical protein